MFQVFSYLKKPQCAITNLNEVVKTPQKYFIEITDSNGINELANHIDFQYLEGAIYLKYYDEVILNWRYWDLVDQLWVYILNLVEDVFQEGEGSMYFPDQPVKLMLRQTSSELLFFSIEGREASKYVLPQNNFLMALYNGAEQFFTCMNNTFGSSCDYSNELNRIVKLKKKLQ